MRTRALAVLSTLLATAGQAAAQTCPSAPWRSLPLATRPAPLAQLDLGNWQGYIKSSLVPHVVGAGVALILSLILLLSFLAWRLVKLCSCCECVRGPQREGKKARKLLTGSGARWVKAAVLLLAAGVLAGGIYGETQVQAVMVDAGLAAITTVTDYIEAALAAGAATVAATQAMDAQLLVVKDGLTGLGPMAAGLAIDDTHSSLSSFTSFDTDLATIRSNTVDRVNTAIDDHSPIARTADKWRGIGLYIAYGVLAGLAVVAAFAMLVDWPAAAKPLILLFLILMLLVWIFVVALTAVLRVGNDVCVNVEDKLMEAVSGSGSFSLGSGGSGKPRRLTRAAATLAWTAAGAAAALVQYYLFGTGGTVLTVLNSTMGIDVDASLATANATLIDLQASFPFSAAGAAAIDGNPALAAVSGDFGAVAALFANVSASVDALEVALSYSTFHPVWVGLKSYLCCDLLNSVGSTWTSLIVTASFGLALLIAAFIWIGRMDKLHSLGCCHIYSARDYSLEGEGRGDKGGTAGADGALLAAKKKEGLAPISVPQSPIMARKEGYFPPPSPSGASTKARLTPPQFHSVATGEPVAAAVAAAGTSLYPPVHGEPPSPSHGASQPPPPPAVAIPGSGSYPTSPTGSFVAPNEAELRAEAQRAAQLAGRAFSMATQAQNLLECIARTSSGMSQGGRLSNLSSPHAGAVPSSPPSWTAPPPHFSNT